MNGDELRLLRIEKAKVILNHPAFVNASPEKQETVIQRLRAMGLNEDDLQMLLQEQNQTKKDKTKREQTEREQIVEMARTLENLPYDIFFSIVTRGDILEDDLIALCGVSRTLSEMCNRGRDVQGEIQSQFLFRELLRKMGKPVKEGMTPRESYIYYATLPKVFQSLDRRIREYSDLLEILNTESGLNRETYPKNISRLLYLGAASYLQIKKNEKEREAAFLFGGPDPGNSNILFVVREIIDFGPPFSAEDMEILSNALRIIRLDYKNLSAEILEWFIAESVRVLILDFNDALEHFEFTKNTYHLQDIIEHETSIHDNSHTFRYLADVLEPYGYSQLMEQINNLPVDEKHGLKITKEQKVEIEAAIKKMITDYIAAQGLLRFTDEEKRLIIDIHKAVLEGRLPLHTAFNFDAIYPAL